MMDFGTKDAFVAFLYEIIRDHVPCGVIARILEDQRGEIVRRRGRVKTTRTVKWSLENAHLGRYAEEVVAELKDQCESISRCEEERCCDCGVTLDCESNMSLCPKCQRDFDLLTSKVG